MVRGRLWSPYKSLENPIHQEADVCHFLQYYRRQNSSPLEPGETINSIWYTESCLPKVIEAIHVQRPGTGLSGTFLHHDNASSNTSKMTRQFVEESGLQLLPHPPYSPDLAPCDFWLFPRIKKHLKGKKFDSNSEVEEGLHRVMGDVAGKRVQRSVTELVCTDEKCIDANGGYFEQFSEIVAI